MRYTRSQCAKLFGISMDTLRYYEKIGLIDAQREKSGRVVYTGREIMTLLDYKLVKSFGGLSGEELLGCKTAASHRTMFEVSIRSLQAQRDELDRRINMLSDMSASFETIYRQLDRVRIGSLPERQFLLFDEENEPLIAEAMRCLPYLKYGYWIDRDCLRGARDWVVKLAIDVSLLADVQPALYRRLRGSLRSNGCGMKVYRYRIYEDLEALRPEDFAPLGDYAREHRFALAGDVFGGILGPELFPEQNLKGFILTQTIQIDKF